MKSEISNKRKFGEIHKYMESNTLLNNEGVKEGVKEETVREIRNYLGMNEKEGVHRLQHKQQERKRYRCTRLFFFNFF